MAASDIRDMVATDEEVNLKRVLITGASGFVGRFVLEHLIANEFEVHAVASKTKIGQINDGKIIWHFVDLLNTIETSLLVGRVKPTHCLHLAWLTTPGIFFESPENIKWIQATLNLAECFAKNGGKRFVGAGTCFETLLPEESATFYGFCKHATKEIVQKYFEKLGVDFAWGRIYFLYGPFERPERLVPSVINGLLKGQEVLCSSGNQVRDYMYVKDCAQGFANLISETQVGEFEIASGKAVKLRELIFRFAEALGRSDLIKIGARPDRVGEPLAIIAKGNLLDTHSFSSDSCVRETIEYWCHQQQ